MDWDALARDILRSHKLALIEQRPPGYGVIVRWRDRPYFGSLQQIAPGYSLEVVLLSKTSRPLVPELEEAILREDQSLARLVADGSLDLEGRTHLLRRAGDQLTTMTAEQTRYVAEHPLRIDESGVPMHVQRFHLYPPK